ncbi:MAG: oxidoreductase [Burkholderiales bacterium RIFCSPLOWO2_02_FULL_57_36]|nr:MAG: oxidoreductase [Burkholderiales bacterium RIFCSPLOWO2_02_FULL_57_36]
MSKNVKVAIVGAGNMATEHLKAFSAIEGVQPAGIFSRTPTRAVALAATYPQMSVCDSIEDLYNKTRADIVVVTVRELAMATVAVECFKFPWIVLLEKPAGYDLVDATRILDAAQKANSKVYVALNRRAYSSTRGALGELDTTEGKRFIKVLDQQDQQVARNIIKEPEAVVQNYMFANSIHLIDYFRVFGRGGIAKVTPVVPWNPAEPGIVISKIEFTSGDIGLYEALWDGPGPWAVSVATPQKRLEMRPLEQVTVQLRGERRLSSLDISTSDTSFKPGLLLQAQQAVAVVRGETNFLPTLHDSWYSMKLVADIYGIAS